MKKRIRAGRGPVAILIFAMLLTWALTACGTGDSAGGDQAGSGGAGGTGDGAFSGKINVISREDGSGTRSAFIEALGIMTEAGDQTTPKAEITQSTAVVMTTVEGDKRAIGYVSLGVLGKEPAVKAISIDGVEATAETIKDGSYGVSREFSMVTGPSVSQAASAFCDYILSEEGQRIVAEEGYIPALEGAEPYAAKSTLSGKVVVAGSTSVAPVMQVLADGFRRIYTQVEIEIQQTGSGAGITSTLEGACDVGMSSRPLKADEVARGLREQVIGLDGIVVVVNRENPAIDLTADQIRRIFTGEVSNWEAVLEEEG